MQNISGSYYQDMRHDPTVAQDLSNPVRLYRWYNLITREYDHPYAMCDRHAQREVTPEGSVRERISDSASVACGACLRELLIATSA